MLHLQNSIKINSLKALFISLNYEKSLSILPLPKPRFQIMKNTLPV